MRKVLKGYEDIIRQEGYSCVFFIGDLVGIALRHPSLLHWCGYVGVPKNHSLYDKGYDDLPFDCHGGLTYADSLSDWKADDRWFLGFDCAHSGDITPYEGYSGFGEETYKTLDYVKNEIEKLAEQIRSS